MNDTAKEIAQKHMKKAAIRGSLVSADFIGEGSGRFIHMVVETERCGSLLWDMYSLDLTPKNRVRSCMESGSMQKPNPKN